MTLLRDDENALVIPKRWHSYLMPRRGGTPVRMAPPDATAIKEYRGLVESGRADIQTVLSHPRTNVEYREAAARYLDGRPDPLGAAVVTRVLATINAMEPPTDTWISDHGAGFAALAMVEITGIRVIASAADCTNDCRHGRPAEHIGHWRVRSESEHREADYWSQRVDSSALRQVRGWLAGMDESAYRDTVEELAKRRLSPAKRLTAAFLVPTQREWVDECCRENHDDPVNHLRLLLFCAISSAEQVDLLGALDQSRLWTLHDSVFRAVVTLVDGLGAASLPILELVLAWPQDLAYRRRYAEIVSLLPSDAAMVALAAGLGDDKVRAAAFTAAMRRFPRRTARVLAAVVGGDIDLSETAMSQARILLGSRLRTEPDLAASITPDLSTAAAAAVADLDVGTETDHTVPESQLPRLLVDPPWSNSAKTRRVTVDDLDVPGEPRLSWNPDERTDWHDLTTYEHGLYGPWELRVERYHKRWMSPVTALRLFACGPSELVTPLLSDWNFDADGYQADRWTKKVVARFGLDAYGVAVAVARSRPTDCGGVLLPFASSEVATLMAGWLAAKTRARNHAGAWFNRHGGTAAELLLPAAVGKAGAGRSNAEAALRFIARERGAEVVHEVAARHGEKVAAAVAALSLTDPLAQLPAKIPKLGAWMVPAALPPLRRSDDARRLPDTAVSHVLTMLAMRSHTADYVGWEVLRELCDADSLRRFCWGVFELWRSVGEPAPGSWALRQLSIFGDDDTVARLLPVIMEWRGKAEYNSSNAGLEVLAAIGTVTALDELYRVYDKAGRMSFRRQAEQKLSEVAADRGLDADRLLEHLECRAVPDLGLDAAATLRLDYGPRGFTVGFDENLTTFIVDDQGRRMEKLPRAVKTDDKELAKATGKTLRKLKKDVDAFADKYLLWLESAMRNHRRFTAPDFFDLFTRHPLLSRMGRRLVWSCHHDTTTAFRIAEDGSFATVDEAEFTPPAEAEFSVTHPFELADIEAWREIFDDYELLQPIEQVHRIHHALTEAERNSPTLDRLNGRVITQFDCDMLEPHGWECNVQQSVVGAPEILTRHVGPNRAVYVTLTNADKAAGKPVRFGSHYRLLITDICIRELDHDPNTADDVGSQPTFGLVNATLMSDMLHDLVRAADRAETESTTN